MKAICSILCVLLMVSHNFANEAQNQDERGKLLQEMRKISKTLGLYLKKMDSMAEQINSIEDQITDLGNQCSPQTNKYPCNCLDLLRQGHTESGIYELHLGGNEGSPILVYCDMHTDGGGWLVFQRRADGSENFLRDWNDYKNGFGNITNEFWLGNDILYQILNSCSNQYELRIDMADSTDNRYAKYAAFSISDEDDNYRLNVGEYSGNAGDSFTDNNESAFTTLNQDNDGLVGNCASEYQGAWWYTSTCGFSNLNGRYYWGSNADGYGTGVNWYEWKGFDYSLKFTEMKIRPNVLQP